MAEPLPLLIIGAGPYALALSAYARRMGIDHLVAGPPMDFWKSHMPKGMYLRSGCDWHFDPFGDDTIERYLQSRQLTPAMVEPLARDAYLEYCEWFRLRKEVPVLPKLVRSLDGAGTGPSYFQATFADGETCAARVVVLALGFGYFPHVPTAYAALFPADRWEHTCELVDFEPLRRRRVLILGGRQSAFEWAACAREQGAERVYVSYRHPTPAFARADWSWVNPIVDAIAEDPGWFRRLSEKDKEGVTRRLWAEGRLKVEPWLAQRIEVDGIELFPGSRVTGCREHRGAELEVSLDEGTTLRVHQVILATGYQVDIARVPLLSAGNLMPKIETQDGFPVLDERFQSSVPGLFFTSMCAVRDFGPYFAFTAAVRTAARVIGASLCAVQRTG